MVNLKKKNIIKIISSLLLALAFYNANLSLATILIYYTIPYQTEPSYIDLATLDEIVWGKHEHRGLVGIYDLIERETRTAEATSIYFSEQTREELRNRTTFLNRFFSMDRRTGVRPEYLDIDFFLDIDLSIRKTPEVPQVLVFHTHAMSEFFIDGGEDIMEGIVGVGATLVYYLRSFGLNVIHYKGVYDMIDGVIYRSGAYERIEPSIIRILEENPTIELVLDIHRDGVPETTNPNVFRRYINGRPTAAIMFVNGLSGVNENGYTRRLTGIPNPYVRENMALTFNMQMALQYHFGDITRRMFLTPFRYINHLRPHSMLVEVGTQLNTSYEAHNAMEPLAYTLYSLIFSH
ncbi:MAG: stage II sporulation protein P [Defluviitaleaceae bacterium]|nr:stage II sporulation protein P [Defluviitaleaceae bacterium]